MAPSEPYPPTVYRKSLGQRPEQTRQFPILFVQVASKPDSE